MSSETLPSVDVLRERLRPLIISANSPLAQAGEAFVVAIAGQLQDAATVKGAWEQAVLPFAGDRFLLPAFQVEFRDRIVPRLFDAEFARVLV